MRCRGFCLLKMLLVFSKLRSERFTIGSTAGSVLWQFEWVTGFGLIPEIWRCGSRVTNKLPSAGGSASAMSHVERRDKDRWRARYIGPDGRERSRTFTRKVDAERFLATVDADIVRGDWVDPSRGRKTLGDWAAEYERSRVHLQPTTRAQREVVLRVHILPALGTRQVASISPMDVRSFIGALSNQGMAPSHVTKNLRILSQIMKAAVQERLIIRNPCEGVRGPGEAPVDETIFLTPRELGALADETPTHFRAMVELAGYRGVRFGEAAGLRPKRIDLVSGRLEVGEALKEVSGRLYFGLPKHGRRRQFALPRFLIESLREHLREFPPHNDLVFTNADGSMLRRSNFDRRVFQPAVRRAGLSEDLTFHGLRHTAVSILISQGASIVELATIMGWSPSTAVAMSVRYGHLFAVREEHLTEALDRVYLAARRPADGLGEGRSPEAPEQNRL